MSDKIKKLCKWDKAKYVKDLKTLKSLVAEPTHFCKDCGRVANEKEVLCKPVKL